MHTDLRGLRGQDHFFFFRLYTFKKKRALYEIDFKF